MQNVKLLLQHDLLYQLYGESVSYLLRLLLQFFLINNVSRYHQNA